jgi:hypothetical protein
MWKVVFNVNGVIFKFESPKRKTHEIHKNNAPSKIFKKYDFGSKYLKNKQKLQFIWTYENQILTIQKF